MPTPGPDTPPAGSAPTATPNPVVRAATVVSSAGVLSNSEVVLDGALIAEVRPATAAVPDVVLVPGFVDLQVNGIGGVDVASAAGSDWAALDQALLAQGVTTWCPTIVTAPLDALEASLAAVASAARRPGGGRPEIAGAHLEGPFLAVPGAHRPQFVRGVVDLAWLDSLGSLVRVLTLAPELPGAGDAIARLSNRGWLVSIGHSACSAEVALEAADAGARLVTHLGNAMGPLHQRAPGLLGVALADDRLAVSVIADLVHTHPVFVRMAFSAKGAHGVALVTDAVAIAGGAIAGGAIAGGAIAGGAIERGGPAIQETTTPPRLPDGTLAGSVLTMPGAIANAVHRCAVPLAEAVEAASTTPARLLGMDDRGAITAGRRADLVALEPAGIGAWRVASVWLAGSPAWPTS